jgi:hypothetical protein
VKTGPSNIVARLIRRTVRRHEIERLRVVAERIGSAVKYLERKQNGR